MQHNDNFYYRVEVWSRCKPTLKRVYKRLRKIPGNQFPETRFTISIGWKKRCNLMELLEELSAEIPDGWAVSIAAQEDVTEAENYHIKNGKLVFGE
jgi:hypothetical protein